MAWVGDLNIVITSGGSDLAVIKDKAQSIQLLDDIICERIIVDDGDFKGARFRNSIVIKLGEYHIVAEIHNQKLWIKYLKEALWGTKSLENPVLSYIIENQCRSAHDLHDAFPEMGIQKCAGYIGSAVKMNLLR